MAVVQEWGSEYGLLTLKNLANSILSISYQYLIQRIIHLESMYVNVKISS